MSVISLQDPGAQPQAIFSHPLVRALDKPIKPARAGVFYQLGLVLVLVMMLLLPVIYVGLIGGVGYLVYLHAINDAFILGGVGRVALFRFFIYVAPMLAGGILIVFMIKPLFARERIVSTPLTVTEKEQPLLHAFVRRLADVVRAPRPVRIDITCDVNASASFESGIFAFLRRDLVLTIGLPLVSGLDAKQFTSVLAHELGHFAQRGGMRLTYLIRRLNAWFARIVYERDGIDDALQQAMHGDTHWTFQIVALLAMLFVGISRLILKVMMILAHAVSSFMLRQMEFDADRCASRVASSKAAIDTFGRLPLIQIASQAAFSDLSDAWREQRLADDLPLLIRSRQQEMPEEIKLTVTKAAREGRTGWFDSHPSDSDRIRSLRKENAPGLFEYAAPATEMFKDYEDLARRATVALYHAQLGGAVKPQNLVPTSSLIQHRGKARETYEALKRYFQDLIHPIRPIFIENSLNKVTDSSAAAELLLDLRSRFSAGVADATAAAAEFSRADEQLIALLRYQALRAAGIRKLDPKEFKLLKGDDVEVSQATAAARQRRDHSLATLGTILGIGVQRLELALAIENGRQGEADSPAPADDYGEYNLTDVPVSGSSTMLREVLFALRGSANFVEEIRREAAVLGALLSHCKAEKNPEQLVRMVMASSRKLANAIVQIQQSIKDARYPFASAGQSLTLAQYAIKAIPPPEAVTDVYRAADSLIEGMYTVYARTMSELCVEAERIEADLGLPPLEPASA